MTPKRAVGIILRRLVPGLMAERDVRRQYFTHHGRYPNIRSPKLYSEKIQHRMLFDNDSRLSLCSDKVLVKDYVRERLGDEMLIPTLYSGPALPPLAQRNWNIPFVIKANHGSGYNIFVRTEADLVWTTIENRLSKFLSEDFGTLYMERHYSKIKRQVIVEPLLVDDGKLPIDYKMFVFGGMPKFIEVITDREREHKEAVFDADWRRQDIRLGLEYPIETREISKPKSLKQMLMAASALGRDFDFVRVDFYEIAGRPYFGEMTFTPGGGLKKCEPPEFDLMLGQMWPANART